jgi:hypothetical protein
VIARVASNIEPIVWSAVRIVRSTGNLPSRSFEALQKMVPVDGLLRA